MGLVTEQFRGLAAATARGKRLPDLPIMVLPRGYDEWPEEEIRADVRARMPELLSALTQRPS